MDAGFLGEWVVHVIAYGVIARLADVGWGATILLALLLGSLAAGSLVLMPLLRIPINVVTVLAFTLVVNAILIYIATGVFGVGDAVRSPADALWGAAGVAIIRGLIRQVIGYIQGFAGA